MNHPPNNDNDNADNDHVVALGIAAAADDHDEDGGDDDDDDEDIFDPAEMEQICTEAMTLLQNRLNLPSRLRERTMVRFAQQFINNVKEDIHETITDTRLIEEGYDGLDSERDTEKEVETAIRSCPEVLTRRDERFGVYPIKCLTIMQGNDGDTKIALNTKAVSFVHLFVQLAIEFNSFEENERGGLLIENGIGKNILHNLVISSDSLYDENHHQLVDTTFLAVLIRLRQSGYLLQEDIQQYELVHELCQNKYFHEQRFRRLIEWDPSSLLHTNVEGSLPFHYAADNLRVFKVLLDAYFRYYPKWRGINALFQKNKVGKGWIEDHSLIDADGRARCAFHSCRKLFKDSTFLRKHLIKNHSESLRADMDGETPFQMACNTLTRATVMEVVEEVLARYTTNNGLVNANNGNAMVLAAIDDSISLDGLYFSIRRQPDTMLSMLRHREEEEESTTMVSSSNNDNNNNNTRITNRTIHDPGVDSTASEENNGTEDGRHNENTNTPGDNINNDHGVNINHNTTVTVLRRSTRKRKRN